MTQHVGNYSTSAVSPIFYGIPQILKTGTPLRPIVLSRGSITYGVAKELASIIHPVVGQSPHHIRNTQHFVQHIQQAKLELGEVMASYHVKALLTSVSVDPSIQKVQLKLQQDSTLHNRTNMSIPHIIQLLKFCLKTHTSTFRVSIMNRYMVLPWAPPSVLS